MVAGDDGWVLVEGPGTLPASVAGSGGLLGPCLMKPKMPGDWSRAECPHRMGPCVHALPTSCSDCQVPGPRWGPRQACEGSISPVDSTSGEVPEAASCSCCPPTSKPRSLLHLMISCPFPPLACSGIPSSFLGGGGDLSFSDQRFWPGFESWPGSRRPGFQESWVS